MSLQCVILFFIFYHFLFNHSKSFLFVCLFFSYFEDQVEHAHDNPLDVITLGEGDATANVELDEMPAEKPVVPKKMNLEIDREPEVKCEGANEAQVEGKKTKKKDVKKDKAKRKR